MAEKDLKYWRERGERIERRLFAAEQLIREIRKDLAECDERIKKLLKDASLSVRKEEGEDG